MDFKKRYESLFKRDFAYNLELYLFELFFKKELQNADPIKFSNFEPQDLTKENYRNACQIKSNNQFNGINISELDKEIEKWYSEKDLKPYKDLFRKVFEDKLSKEEFNKVYTSNSNKNQCHYCGIFESDITILNDKSEIKTKRLQTRGEKMEIDRIDPYGSYSANNITLACYWCNNAKTDEFSYFEFKKFIAPKIQEVWEIRLQYKLNPPEMKRIDEIEK